MLTSHRYQVIVVGGRVAGAAVAMLLAERGVRVLVLERSARGHDTLSTHALMRGGVLQLARWGLLDSIVAAGTPPVRRTTFTVGGERTVISIKPSPPVDALYAPRRTLLDPLLADGATAAGAEFRHGCTVTGLLWRNGRVVGVRTATDGVVEELDAELVIGADGIRSTVAELTGAAVTRQGRYATACTYGYWSDLDTDGYEWVFRPDACSGIIPTNGGSACVFASGRRETIGRGGVELIGRIVAAGDPEIAERLAAATPPKATRTWPGLPGFFRQAHGPGWALVGDAGYYRDPIGAHGLTDALRDAELLARAVADFFGADATLSDALDGYEATRDRLSVPLFETSDEIASMEWDDVEVNELLRRLSSSMTDEVDLLSGLDTEVVA
jgi:2-polyprenyl-6-methoxyphenol hydroxylase-like FAD-dependent oxidoreductase